MICENPRNPLVKMRDILYVMFDMTVFSEVDYFQETYHLDIRDINNNEIMTVTWHFEDGYKISGVGHEVWRRDTKEAWAKTLKEVIRILLEKE